MCVCEVVREGEWHKSIPWGSSCIAVSSLVAHNIIVYSIGGDGDGDGEDCFKKLRYSSFHQPCKLAE